MKTEKLRINQLAESDYRWYLDYLAAMDARDVERYAGFLDDKCSISFNNEPPTEGKRQIAQRLTEYWQSFASVEHDLLNIYGAREAFMLEALNDYVRLDGKPVVVRAVALTDCNTAGLVTSVRLYTDVAEVFA